MISDIAVPADQHELFGTVASGSTCWRVLDALDERVLARVAAARARAREIAWAQRAEATVPRQAVTGVRHAGIDALVIDMDAHVRRSTYAASGTPTVDDAWS